MADKKISALTGATTPLAGTEVLPIVQSSSTVKVSVDNLTIGKPVETGLLTVKKNQSGVSTSLTVQNGNSGANSDVSHIFSTANGNWTVNVGRSTGLMTWTSANAIEVFRIANAGDTTVSAGNLVVGTAGKGIDFSANGGDVLTQYDEGTWNPTVGSGSGTITSYTATGTYTRVGRQVTLAGEITITNNGTGASDIRISGLPFAAASVNFAGVGVNGASGATVGVTFAATNTLIMFKYDGTYPVATGQQILFNVTYFV